MYKKIIKEFLMLTFGKSLIFLILMFAFGCLLFTPISVIAPSNRSIPFGGYITITLINIVIESDIIKFLTIPFLFIIYLLSCLIIFAFNKLKK